MKIIGGGEKGKMVKVRIDGGTAEILNIEDKDILTVVKIVYPLGENYGNSYYDGIKFVKGRKKVRISHFGGGSGWARRGSMLESWDDEDVSFISVEEFEELLKKIDEINKIEDEIDKEAEIMSFVKEIFEEY